MTNRISSLFQKKSNSILNVYFTAGFPKLDDTLEIILHLANSGVDLIEIGIPFSDPLADGPVIQESNQQALENGMSLRLLFEQLSMVRQHTQVPIVLMGYLNPVLQFGISEFVSQMEKCGIDGLILPDMPLHYYHSAMEQSLYQANIYPIFLITPQTSEERIRLIDQTSRGFIYMVSSNSITGGRQKISDQTDYFRRVASLDLKNPKLIGFGISGSDDFELACRYAQGGIVGSAFIRHLHANDTSEASIRDFIQTLIPREA